MHESVVDGCMSSGLLGGGQVGFMDLLASILVTKSKQCDMTKYGNHPDNHN